jgi:quercetin dioxygenase-like cupin family protein
MHTRRTAKPSLDPLFGAIAQASTPDAFAPERAAALKQKLLARVAADADSRSVTTVRAQEGEWIAFAPGMDIKILYETPEAVSALVRMAPGAEHPWHSHGADEECLVLEGEIYFDEVRARPGDYHVARRGSEHAMRTESGVLMFVRTGASVLHPPAAPGAA